MTQAQAIQQQIEEARKRQLPHGTDPNQTTKVEVGSVKFHNLFSN